MTIKKQALNFWPVGNLVVGLLGVNSKMCKVSSISVKKLKTVIVACSSIT